MPRAALRSLILWVLLSYRPRGGQDPSLSKEDLDPYPAYLQEVSRAHALPIRYCKLCGIPFVPYRPKKRSQLYCTKTCREIAHLRRNRDRRREEHRTPEGRAKKRWENDEYRKNVALRYRIPIPRSPRPSVEAQEFPFKKVREILQGLSRFGPVPPEAEVALVFQETLRLIEDL